jgi:carbonic anhydrase/acetyltransferase-like protein (isoleucine patch superfamily)
MSLPAADLPTGALHFASSAVLLGTVRVGQRLVLAQGAVVRSQGAAVRIGADSAVLENCAVIGRPGLDVSIGRKVVFGHRCLVVGATVGDLCEIGNGSVLMPGARLGNGCFLGEGTLIPSGAMVPDDSVVVGRPGRSIRRANSADRARLLRLREGDLSLSNDPPHELSGKGNGMGQLYAFRDKTPMVAGSAFLFGSAEVTGDVVIGERTIIGAGVKIIGDSHGPVRIGSDVQILENTVLHLLPDNELVLEDGVIIGPGAMIHGCRIGRGSVVEPGAIVCDSSELGANCLVRAGSVVKQRARFPAGAIVDGFPAAQVGNLTAPQPLPAWALRQGDLGHLTKAER